MHVYMCVSVCLCIHMSVCVCEYVSVWVYVCECTCVCERKCCVCEEQNGDTNKVAVCAPSAVLLRWIDSGH